MFRQKPRLTRSLRMNTQLDKTLALSNTDRKIAAKDFRSALNKK